MYIRQSDLLEGLSKDFVEQVKAVAEEESHKKGYTLFREGDRAKHIYILMEGRVRITIGETGHTVYTVDHPEEVFGWSSLLGRKAYSASAECREATRLLKISADKLEKLLEKDQVNGVVFFRHLAATLGSRLLESYKMISGTAQADLSLSFGTGQVQESETKVS
jgi:CRP/FNR family transcriptional regulator, cyclic AMP receptor protein